MLCAAQYSRTFSSSLASNLKLKLFRLLVPANWLIPLGFRGGIFFLAICPINYGFLNPSTQGYELLLVSIPKRDYEELQVQRGEYFEEATDGFNP